MSDIIHTENFSIPKKKKKKKKKKKNRDHELLPQSLPETSQKEKAARRQSSSSTHLKSNQLFLVSETPFKIKIRKFSQIPKNQPVIPCYRKNAEEKTTTRSGRRVLPQKRKYDGDSDEESDDNSSSSDEEMEFDDSNVIMGTSSQKSQLQLQQQQQSHSQANTKAPVVYSSSSAYLLASNNAAIESPPPGIIASLWYTHESHIHVSVVEKILSLKTRKVVRNSEKKDDLYYAKLATRVLGYYHSKGRNDLELRKKRMDVSRINPSQCPIILQVDALLTGKSLQEEEEEEVLLVKWRGHSYLHSSWERESDLIRMDPPNSARPSFPGGAPVQTNNIARQRIKKFYASQELHFGKNWKNDENNHKEELDLFPTDYLEVDRILVCDEDEMDLDVLKKQFQINEKLDDFITTEDDDDDEGKINKQPQQSSINKLREEIPKLAPETPWDPEDNVRYIVKWKRLTSSEITWEYWRDLKFDSDALQKTYDYWLRQKEPTDTQIKQALERRHPSLKDYSKLKTSPNFGFREHLLSATTLSDKISSEGTEDSSTSTRLLTLRNYQLEGVNWILWNWFNKRSCILADEMGLGKTIQTMTFLEMLNRQQKVRGPFLVVVPLSLISQWQSEAHMWTPNFNVIVYHGSAAARNFIVQNEFYYDITSSSSEFGNNNAKKSQKAKAALLNKSGFTKFNICITTYEVILKDAQILGKVRWKALVVDEAHRLKNPRSRLFSDLLSIKREFCLLLTGTPLQNSTEELWALLYFCDPCGFKSKDQFLGKFGQLTKAQQVQDLHGILKPYLLRRVKEDVEKTMPPKEETILEVTLTPIQKKYYKAIYEKNTNFLFQGTKNSNAPSLMNIMMELRKCCNHPFLIKGAEERIWKEKKPKPSSKDDDNNDSSSSSPSDKLKVLENCLIESSGKMVLLSKLLPHLKKDGHKVLIFSQMVRVLDLLEDLLRFKQYKYERLDGSVPASVRTQAVDRFCSPKFKRDVMLLSTRAGGLGLNLTAADTVIIYDSDWNPQNDLQAMARAHRIGQTRAVRVYRLLTAKTYEMHMFHSASMKLGLDRAVLAQQREGEKSKKNVKQQAKEIDELLKKGAYDVFRDEVDDKESQNFMETDIDSLLARSSRKVTYGENTSGISSGLGSFSKASFVASTQEGGEDIDLDDPDFWKKAIGLKEEEKVPEDQNNLQEKKRNRKQVQQFDPYAAFAEAEQRKIDQKNARIKEEKRKEKERIKQEKLRAKESKKLKKEKKKSDKKKNSEKSHNNNNHSEKNESTNSSSEKEETNQKRVRALETQDELILASAMKVKLFLCDTTAMLAQYMKKYLDLNSPLPEQIRKLKPKTRDLLLHIIYTEDPQLERLKQAWQFPQSSRLITAILQFGFPRFPKIRHASHLNSLPIQDVELFSRAYVYQLGLQASVSIMKKKKTASIEEVIQIFGKSEGTFILKAVQESLDYYSQILQKKKTLRLPPIFAESNFVHELQNGAALHGLRRIAFLSRLTRIIEKAVNKILQNLSHEEIGKRGCPTTIGNLDVDLKVRYVTIEELCHAIELPASLISHHQDSKKKRQPVIISPWWDRYCDVALLVGTFIHGLGEYQAMKNDPDLPFGFRISQYAFLCMDVAQAYQNFNAACTGLKTLCETKKGETLIKEMKNVVKKAPPALSSMMDSSIENDTKKKDKGDDESKGLTIQRISLSQASNTIIRSIRSQSQSFFQKYNYEATKQKLKMKKQQHAKSDKVVDEDNKSIDENPNLQSWNNRLPMPDAPILDEHLLWLVDTIEQNNNSFLLPNHETQDHVESQELDLLKTTIATNNSISIKAAEEGTAQYFDQKAFISSECGSVLNNMKDDSSYVLAPVSSDLSVGDIHNTKEEADTSVGSMSGENAHVSNILTCYGINSLVYTDEKTLNICLKNDKSGKINTLFEENVTERANICVLLLQHGSPLFRDEKSFSKVHLSVWAALYGDDDGEDEVESRKFYNMKKFVHNLNNSNNNGVDIQEESTANYINQVLLPHCIKLCLNIPSTTQKDITLSHIPDPYVPLSHHSHEAIRRASAILRRVKLMKAIRFIVGGGVSVEVVLNFLKGSKMRSNLNGLPSWWCPWIHDLGLLVYAATHGLFGLFTDIHENQFKEEDQVFGTEAIMNHIRIIFFDGKDGLKPALPRSLLSSISEEQKQQFLQDQTKQFPEQNLIEQRLAFVCSELTEIAADMNARNQMAEWRFEMLPMFDHGGWPCLKKRNLQFYHGNAFLVDSTNSVQKTAEDEEVSEIISCDDDEDSKM